MIDREKVIKQLDEIGRYFFDIYRKEDDQEESFLAYDRADVVANAIALLRDTTNPKGGSCSTCSHEYEPGSDYCLAHQKCKVCGICSGYEGGDGND